MSLILFIDLETSDLIKWNLPLDDPAQPWIVELAASVATTENVSQGLFWTQIRAEGRSVRSGAERIHGISSRMAARQGVQEIRAISTLLGMADQCSYVAGYGVDFFKTAVKSTLLRREKNPKSWIRPGLEFICVKEAATAYCKLPDESEGNDHRAYRRPSLDEAYKIILGGDPRPRACAFDDMCKTREIFFALKSLGCLPEVDR